jgi:acylphosphatase
MNEVRMKIYGQVHGVGFRYYTALQARNLNLTGYARNLPNGTVEIVAQGSREDLEKLIQWARTGPPAAGVERVELEHVKSGQKYIGFNVV